SADRTAVRADLEKARASGATDAEVYRLIASLEQRSQPQVAQPGNLRWLAHVGDTYSNFSAGRSAWSEYDASVRGYFPRGSLAVESLAARRFSLTDRAFALDGYTDAWSRAYLNLAYPYSSNATLSSQRV